jgi:phage-related protein
MVKEAKSTPRASISWEGNSLEELRSWPEEIREDLGNALGEIQDGLKPRLVTRPMPTIAAGVFELKDYDEAFWYRLIYLAKRRNVICVLHCFKKKTGKTERKDMKVAEDRLSKVNARVLQAIREEKRDEKSKPGK